MLKKTIESPRFEQRQILMGVGVGGDWFYSSFPGPESHVLEFSTQIPAGIILSSPRGEAILPAHCPQLDTAWFF